MEGVDRLNELMDEMLVNNIMSRLNCTTKELIRTAATISKRWKHLWTQLPHLIFSHEDDITNFGSDDTDLCDYISFIDNTLNKCPANLNLKKFKLDIDYSSVVNSEFKSLANSWIRYAIKCIFLMKGLSKEDVRVAASCAREEVLIRNRFSEINAPQDGSSVSISCRLQRSEKRSRGNGSKCSGYIQQ